MNEIQVIESCQGIWIEEKWLHKAGLGLWVEVEMKNGEICIRPTSGAVTPRRTSEKGWNVFRTLGDDAEEGCLRDASEHHDIYLYGKK